MCRVTDTYQQFLTITSNPIAAAVLTGVKLDRKPSSGLLTAKQAAKLLRVSTDKVYEMCREGVLPHRKVGRLTRFRRADLLAFQSESQARSPRAQRHTQPLSCLR